MRQQLFETTLAAVPHGEILRAWRKQLRLRWSAIYMLNVESPAKLAQRSLLHFWLIACRPASLTSMCWLFSCLRGAGSMIQCHDRIRQPPPRVPSAHVTALGFLLTPGAKFCQRPLPQRFGGMDDSLPMVIPAAFRAGRQP